MPAERPLAPGEILNLVQGLTRDKLSYWSDKGYLPVIVEQRANQNYRFYQTKHVPIIEKAHELIVEGGMKDRQAFNKIYNDLGYSR